MRGMALGDEVQKQVDEAAEKVDAMGQDSEVKAAKWVIEEGKAGDREEKKEADQNLEVLGRRARYKFDNYKQFLTEICLDVLERKVELRKGWKYRTYYNSKGVGLLLGSPSGKTYGRGFAPMNNPQYDLNACVVLCLQAENTIDDIEKLEVERASKTEAGVYLA